MEIGGFFELELASGAELHSDAMPVNLGRSALQLILSEISFDTIYYPEFICESVSTVINSKKGNAIVYSISENLEPQLAGFNINKTDVLYLVNYYGYCDYIIEKLSKEFDCTIIVDNAQSFFSKPISGAYSFYSPRKYFGVADGGYVYGLKSNMELLQVDSSFEKYGAVLKRLDSTAEQAYGDYKNLESAFGNQEPKRMSKLTRAILQSINYENIAKKRRDNFCILAQNLNEKNLFYKSNLNDGEVPMTYIFWDETGKVRNNLLVNKIYCPTYWPELNREGITRHTQNLANKLLPIPIDQRYGEEHMKFIISKINEVGS